MWTGPNRDRLCVTRCTNHAEAQACLAPAAPTVLLATLASLHVRDTFTRTAARHRSPLIELVPIIRRRFAHEAELVAQKLGLNADQEDALASLSAAGSGASISPRTRRSRPSTSSARSPASYLPS